MNIEDKYLNETIKKDITSVHYLVLREIEEVKEILNKIPREYEFQNTLISNKMPEIIKHFNDIKSSLLFLNKISRTKMVFNKK